MRVLLSLALVVSAAGAVATPAAAQGDQPDWAVQMFEDMGPMVEKYNENIEPEDFGLIASQLRGKNVNLVVDDPANNSEATVSFRLDDDLRMQDLEMGPGDDPDIRMSTDKETMDRVIAADDPASAFYNAVFNDDITISGIGVLSGFIWVAIDIIAGVLRTIFG